MNKHFTLGMFRIESNSFENVLYVTYSLEDQAILLHIYISIIPLYNVEAKKDNFLKYQKEEHQLEVF